MKCCTKCKIDKPLEEFPKNKRFKCGYNSICKLCINGRNKEYRDSTINERKASRKRYYRKNISKMREDKKKYYSDHKEDKSKYDIEYRERNKNKIKEYKKQWEKERRHDPVFKIKRNLRRRIHHVLKGTQKGSNTFDLIGCTPEQFKLHIESLFMEGMTWDNYGPTGWHIDHIIPCYKFNLLDEKEQRKCFHYSNQRPLWWIDNLSRPRNI